MDKEIWKPVPSKQGIMASSHGRILLPVRHYRMPHGGMVKTRPKPIRGTKTKATKTARHQYYGVMNRHFGNMKVHRLVCEAFHGPPPNERSVVIHLDEDALNNRPENLKWGTQKENLNMPNFIEYCRTRTGSNSTWAKRARKTKQQPTNPESKP
jgi:hypothetical protein